MNKYRKISRNTWYVIRDVPIQQYNHLAVCLYGVWLSLQLCIIVCRDKVLVLNGT